MILALRTLLALISRNNGVVRKERHQESRSGPCDCQYLCGGLSDKGMRTYCLEPGASVAIEHTA